MTLDTIPIAPGALPVIGHVLRLGRKPLDFMASVPADADMVRIRLGPKTVVLVCDPELTQQVLHDDRTFDKGGPLVSLVQVLVGDGLATCPRARHRAYRRVIQPVFHPGRAPEHAKTLTAGITTVTGSWSDGQLLDVPVEMRRLAIHATVNSLFSGTLPLSTVDRLADDFTTVLVGFAHRLRHLPFMAMIPTPFNRRYQRALADMRQIVAGAIADRRADGVGRDDLLSALLATGPDNAPVLNDALVVDHAATFIAAGTATSSSVLGWALHLLAQHPEIQDRLGAEVDAVLAGAPAGFEHVAELKFTRHIVTETLRMYPSVWFVPTRVVTADTRLGAHRLPAGTCIAFSPYLIHRRADLYDDPERFDPDRWDSSRRPVPPRHAFVPFGTGARGCIASAYAPLEMVLAVATIASRWRLEPVPGRPLTTRASVNLTARGLRVRTVLRACAARADVSPATAPRPDRTSTRSEAGTRRPTHRKAWLI